MTQSSLFEQEVQRSDTRLPLRTRQLEGIKNLFGAIRDGHKHIGFQAPPGFGKTRCAAELISMGLRKGLRPLFTCPAISLIDQSLASFEREGIHDIGVMQANHRRTDRSATVQIASVQTLLRRDLPDVGLILVDEFHEMFDGLNALLANDWKDKIVIGLSATPWSRGLGLHYSKLVIGATFRDMVADGLAHEYPIFGPEKDVERGDLPTLAGEFEEKAASARMSEPQIVGDVLKEWKERSTHEKTFAFCVNRDHARAQMEAFQDAGIPFGYIDANTPVGDRDTDIGTRKHIFAQLRNGIIAGIASVGCLIRGIDEPVTTIMDLTLTQSETRHVQKWGRMRTPDPNAIYVGLDHAGNNQHLGHFMDIFHDTLDDRKPGERKEAYEQDYKPAKPRKCQKCNCLVPAGARSCPTCSQRMPLYPGVTVKDGKLVEMKPKPKPTKEQQAWFSELIWLGKKAGFKEGWPAMHFKEKFGLMPYELNSMKTRGKSPTDEVKSFVKEQRTKFIAERKAKEIADPDSWKNGACRSCGGTASRLCGQPCF